MTIKTRLNSLALAAAVFTSTALLTGGSASADIKHLGQGAVLGITVPPGLGHGPVVPPKPPIQGGSGGSVVSCQIGKGCTVTPPPGHGPVEPPKPPTQGGSGGSVVSCQIGRGCTVTPPPGDDDDHHHHDRYGHDHGYGWGYQPEIVVAPVPAPAVAAPVEAAPAQAPVPQVAQAPCNCLTKQTLPDGSVLFQDICTKQSAIAAPQTVGAR